MVVLRNKKIIVYACNLMYVFIVIYCNHYAYIFRKFIKSEIIDVALSRELLTYTNFPHINTINNSVNFTTLRILSRTV